jgi:smad nuclear-interacting protein 1
MSNLPQNSRSPSPPDDAHPRKDRKSPLDSKSRKHHNHNNDNDADRKAEQANRWGKPDNEAEVLAEKEPEPDFMLSGALAAETNTINGVTIVHTEPQEARNPTDKWRLYVFKNGEALDEPLYIHRQSRYLVGRERRIADIPTDHPSCSKQHAVLQFRFTHKKDRDGLVSEGVRPYIMDLGSTNGTYLNGERIEAERYYELLEKDMIKFGNSSREYVLLKEK